MVVFLNSLFGQFCNDTFLYIPISVMVVFHVIVNFFLWGGGVRTKAVGAPRICFSRGRLKKFLMGFSSKESSETFNPWVFFMYNLKVMLMMINVIGLFPYSLTLTSHISFTYSLAFPLWGAMQLMGFFYYFNFRVSHFLPSGTPWALVPLMVIIEMVGVFIQPVALGLRLAANITAGHLLIFLFSVAIWTMWSTNIVASLVFLLVLFLLFLLEVGVAIMQAYVFVALLHFYYTQNVDE